MVQKYREGEIQHLTEELEKEEDKNRNLKQETTKQIEGLKSANASIEKDK